MKRSLIHILCAVAIMIIALIGLSGVASADSYETMPISVTTTPRGIILDGFYTIGADGNATDTPVRDSASKRTTTEIVRASMQQDFIPVIEEAFTNDAINKLRTSETFPFDGELNGSAAIAHLEAPNWGRLIELITCDLERSTDGEHNVSDAFWNKLVDLRSDKNSKPTEKGFTIYLNFMDNGTVYSLYLDKDQLVQTLREFRKALLESVVAQTYCIYECDGTDTLMPLSTISTDKQHLAYIIHPFVGVIPCNIDGHPIKNFSDYLNTFYALDVVDEWSDIDLDTINVRWLPVATIGGTEGRSFLAFLDAIEGRVINDAREKWSTRTYNCYFQGVLKDDNTTLPDGSKANYIYLHPDYVAFATQFMSGNTEWTTGLTTITDKSGLAVNFSARQNATQKPTCLLNTLHPLGYVSEWRNTDVFGIYTSSFSSAEKGYSSSVGEPIYYNGLCNANTSKESVRYRYDFIRERSAMSTVATEDNEIFKQGNTNALGAYYYYDIATGKVYKNIPNTEKVPIIGGSSYNSSNKEFLCSPMAGRLLARFKETPIILDKSTLQYTTVTMVPPIIDTPRTPLEGITEIEMSSDFITTLIVPANYMECVEVTTSEIQKDAQSGADTSVSSSFMIGTGRRVVFDLSKASTMNLVDTDGTVKFVTSGEPAAGVYYHTGGRLYTSSKDNIKMEVYMLDDGPAIALSPYYLDQSNILSWLETSQAGTYISGNAKITGFTADMLYKHLKDKGVSLGGKVDKDDAERLGEIQDELEANKHGDIVHTIMTVLSFVGIVLMVYACLLVIVFYIDLFNPISTLSLLHIITFGGYKAITRKSDLEDLGITDPKERKHYVDRIGILGLWAVVMGLGLLLFGSNQVFVWATMLYNWLTGLFGI